MADPKDQEQEQAARELAGLLTTCPTVSHLSTPAMGEEFWPHIAQAFRTREESAYKRGQEEMRQRIAGQSGTSYAAWIRLIPISGMEEK